MRHTSTSFYNIPYHIDNCINLNFDCAVEYSIKKPNLIVNFKKGWVLLSYMGVLLDDEGYRMIPDEEIVFTAVTEFILERVLKRKFLTTLEQKHRIAWQMQVEIAEKSIARAREQIGTPDFDEWSQFVRTHWNTIIRYKHWEGNLNRAQGDQYRYPNETYYPRTRRK